MHLNNDDEDAIRQQIQHYFDALYQADADKLRSVFHPQLRYINTVAGDEVNLGLEQYLAIVEQRTSPSSQQALRDEQLISIDIAGTSMAFVKASMVMMQRRYTDFLTLTKQQEQWLIINKTFSYTPLQ